MNRFISNSPLSFALAMVLEEIAFVLGNKPGALQKIAKLLAEGRINVAAISVHAQSQRGYIRMVVSDTERALWLLRREGYKVDAQELIVVGLEDRSGNLLRVLDILAQHKLNITSANVLVSREGMKSLIAIGTDNPPRARELLSSAGFVSAEAEQLITNAGLVSRSIVDSGRESVGMLL